MCTPSMTAQPTTTAGTGGVPSGSAVNAATNGSQSSQSMYGMDPSAAAGLGSLITLLGAYGQYEGTKQGIQGMQGAVNNALAQQQGYNQQIQANEAPLFASSPVSGAAAGRDQMVNAMAAQTNGILKGFQDAGGASSVAQRAALLSNPAGQNLAQTAGYNLAGMKYGQNVTDILGRNALIGQQAQIALQPLQAQITAGGSQGQENRLLGTMGNLFGPAMVKSSFYAPANKPTPVTWNTSGEGFTPAGGWASPSAASQAYPTNQSGALSPIADVADQFDTNTNMLGQVSP